MFASPVRRIDPQGTTGELEALSQWLDFHRATLLMKLEGLEDADLRRPMVPSGTSLLGLVKHLAETEHGWFCLEFLRLDERPLYETPDDPEAGFRIEPHETVDEIVQTYLDQCERARKIVAEQASLEIDVPENLRGRVNLRWILLHMIEETSRHNGHADILREMIDGTTGD
ncbi:DinB family protein [Streptomyces sp. NPDC046862]|uniref:DinB family protein n=1 Tax=Streptomyces sp. NPDC046862 TaxID=3154603 RepID=UPI0034557D7B